MPSSYKSIVIALGVAVVLAVGAVALLKNEDSGAERSASHSPSAASARKTGRVAIKDFRYKPAAVEVTAGSRVTFVNEDSAGHTATGTARGAFDTDRIRRGESKSVTLREPGDYAYICAYHPFMKGTIRVVE